MRYPRPRPSWRFGTGLSSEQFRSFVPMRSGFRLKKYSMFLNLRSQGGDSPKYQALAIRKDFRGKSGEVLLPLQKFLYEYCLRYFVVDYMLIAINPKHVDYYESILCFEKIGEEVVENYSYVSGAPAVGEYLDLRTSIHRWCAIYFNQPPKRDVFSYFSFLEMENIQWPDRTYFKVTDPVMTPELLDYFFNQRTQLFSQISQEEKDLLGLLYDHAKYAAVLPRSGTHRQYREMVQEKRFDVNCKGRILLDQKKEGVTLVVKNVSAHGFGAYLEEDIHFGELLSINIAIGDFDIVDLEAYPLWRDEDGMHGFRVITATPNWNAFIEHLKRDLQKEAEKVAA